MPHVIKEPVRFRMLLAGIMVDLAVSTMYVFSIFTEAMKEEFGFTQGDITTITTVANVMGYCAFIFGVVLDHFGPKVQLCLSGSCVVVGLLLFGLTLDGYIYSTNQTALLIMLCIFLGIEYLGCPSMDGGGTLPLLMHFPLERGYMVVILKTFAGLGTSILMAFYNAFFQKEYSSFAYFLGAEAIALALCAAYLIDFPPYYMCDRVKARVTEEDAEERKTTLKVYMRQHAPIRRIILGCSIVVFLLILLTVSSIVGAYSPISLTNYRVIWVIMMLMLFSFGLMLIPVDVLGRFPDTGADTRFHELGEISTRYTHDGRLATPREPAVDEEREAEERSEHLATLVEPQYQGSFWSHLLTPDLWFFWLSLLGMWGTGTVLTFNAAQIYRSKNHGVYDQAVQSLYVALIGVGSAFGRITGGILDIWVSRRRAKGLRSIHTPLFFPVGAILLAVGFLLMAVIPVEALVLPMIIASMGNGMAWGLCVVCVKIIYAEDVGKHYDFMFSSGIVSTVLLNRCMFGMMFDNKAAAAGTTPYCNTPSCVTPQLWILAGVNVISAVSAFLLYIRFKRFSDCKYAEMGARRQDEDDEREGATLPDEQIQQMLDEKEDPLEHGEDTHGHEGH